VTTKKKQQKQWCGTIPDACENCGLPLHKKFVDGSAPRLQGGAWMILCLSCHARHGAGLGDGLGQMYEPSRDGTKCVKVTREKTEEDNARVDERCARIAREVLGFDPRSVGVELRAVAPLTLQSALTIAYRAGRADKAGR